jgi:hypothetical protein
MKTETTRHEGKLLMDYLTQNGITRIEFCEKLNITLPMLASYSKKEKFSIRLKDKLTAIGVNLSEEQPLPIGSQQQYISELEEEIRLLTQVMLTQKQFINHLTGNCKHGHCLNFILDNQKS